MTNLTAIMIYIPICLMMAIALMGSYQSYRKQAANRSLLFLVSMAFGWQIFEILYFTTENPETARLFVDLKLPFIAFCSVALLFFTLRLYHLDVRVTKAMYVAVILIPLITTVLAVTSPLHNLLREELIILTDGPIHQQINIRGSWFWVHTVYSNAINLITFGIVLYQHRRLPKEHRLPSTIVIIALFLSTICSTATVTGVWKLPINLTLLGNSIAIIMIYVVIMSHDQMDFLMLARKEIFDFMEDGIFVLDHQNVIIEKNAAARKWLEQLGIGQQKQEQTLEQVLDNLRNIGATFKKGVTEEDGFDIKFTDEGHKAIYNIRFRDIYDKTGRLMGMFATCVDVTSNRQLIDQLEEHAGIDVLTGLPNRRSFDAAMELLDHPSYFPLAVLLGDLNSLKSVNDTMGHKHGDRLLRETAKQLAANCPENGRLFRIGGDEFVLLLPKCNQQQAASLIDKINDDMSRIEGFSLTPSIALGYAVKENQAQDLENLLSIADRNMYSRKRKHYYKRDED